MYIFLNVLVLVVFIAGAVGFYRAGALREIVSHLDEDSPSLERRKERLQQYLHLSYVAFGVGFLILLLNWLLV